jgi:hypothetical protein
MLHAFIGPWLHNEERNPRFIQVQQSSLTHLATLIINVISTGKKGRLANGKHSAPHPIGRPKEELVEIYRTACKGTQAQSVMKYDWWFYHGSVQ